MRYLSKRHKQATSWKGHEWSYKLPKTPNQHKKLVDLQFSHFSILRYPLLSEALENMFEASESLQEPSEDLSEVFFRGDGDTG